MPLKKLILNITMCIAGLIMLSSITMFSLSPAYAGVYHSEAEYVDHYCTGTVEFRNIDRTRTDCRTPGVSYEYDFARKWYECITQSLHYGMLNNDKAICVLIMERDTDSRYLDRANALVEHYNIPIKIETVDNYE